ncbi:hypothetical protein KIF59_01410 [Enterobacter cloacae subsp. cloacae]|nr:hypothetical protein [Enterobacter cloacae subsp. cloacae]
MARDPDDARAHRVILSGVAAVGMTYLSEEIPISSFVTFSMGCTSKGTPLAV